MTFISTVLFINILALNISPNNYINRPKNSSITLSLRNSINNSSNTFYRNNTYLDTNTSFNLVLGNKIEEYNKIILNSSIDRYNTIFDKKNVSDFKNTFMFNTLKLMIAKYIHF